MRNMDDTRRYYRMVEVVAAWELEHEVPQADRITYWFGDYGMDAPRYEHRDEIAGKYAEIIAAGHPLLDGSGVYRHTVAHARTHRELDAYRESNRKNTACAEAIDAAIRDSSRELYQYDLSAASKSVVAEHGPDRVAWVLANVVRGMEHDGRISHNHKQWAKAFPIPVEHQPSLHLNTHPAILDGFLRHARQELDNYLRTTELSTEQNANMVDGLRNNLAYDKGDLTDGQTHEELRELAPEALPPAERPSLLEQLGRLKADTPGHDAPERPAPDQPER